MSNLSRRQSFLFSVVLAALLSAPLAAGTVILLWARADHALLLKQFPSAVVWSARMFLMCFDVFALLAWFPCARWLDLRVARLGVSEPEQKVT